MADVTVREAFVSHRDAHLGAMGQLPDGMPYEEEAAEGAMNEEDGGMGGGMGGMGSPPLEVQ